MNPHNPYPVGTIVDYRGKGLYKILQHGPGKFEMTIVGIVDINFQPFKKAKPVVVETGHRSWYFTEVTRDDIQSRIKHLSGNIELITLEIERLKEFEKEYL